MNGDWNDFCKDVRALKDKYGVKDSDIFRAFQKAIQDTEHENIIKRAEENLKYVGRYYVREVEPHSGMFPKMKRYYKVLSNQSTNEYHLEVLRFDEHPTYWFNSKISLMSPAGNLFLGHFDFDSFIVHEVFITNFIKEATEITEEEYWNAAKNYISELQDLKWTTDHWRFSGVLPSDPKWDTSKPNQDES